MIDGWEKRDIVEVLQELGLELTPAENSDRPYYKAFCPFHDNKKTEAFFVFPSIQRCQCYACWDEGGDVIDFTRKLLKVSFKEALQRSCVQVDTLSSVAKRALGVQEAPRSSAVPIARIMRRVQEREAQYGRAAAMRLLHTLTQPNEVE